MAAPTAPSKKEYRTYSLNDRLRAVSLSADGLSSTEIGRELGVDGSLVRRWLRRYRDEGLDGLKSRRSSILVPDALPSAPDSGRVSGPSAVCGFVRRVDNPSVLKSMVDNLASYGVDATSVTVGDSPTDYVRSLRFGSLLVVNSLFDLSSDIADLLLVLGEALDRRVSVVSLSDDGLRIDSTETDTASLLRRLGGYARMAGLCSALSSSSPRRQGRPSGTVSRDRLNRYRKAYDLYSGGASMSSAARSAGCTYASFRRWVAQNSAQQY